MSMGDNVKEAGGFKFALGEIIAISPIPKDSGISGRITSLVFDEDGGRSYMVSALTFDRGGAVARHMLNENDVQKVPTPKEEN